MNMKVAVILAFLALLVFVDANRRRQGGRRQNNWRQNRRQPPIADIYSWTRELENNVRVQENALVNDVSKIVTINSSDVLNLNGSGFQAAKTVYFFPENEEPLMVIATEGNRRGRPCFLADTDFTYEEMVAELVNRNTSSSALTTYNDMFVDGTMSPLPRDQAQALYRAYPGLRRRCRRNLFDSRLDATMVEEDEVDEPETRTIKVLSFDAEVEIEFPVARRGRGQGGRRGQGQGRGQGLGRGQGRRHRGGRRHGRRQGRGNVQVDTM